MCIFCEIVKGNIPATKILEDENCLAFKDINPIAPIHILIIPKKHIKNFAEADENTIAKLSAFTKKVTEKLNITDYRIITNNGENAGQEVFHFHIHLIANPDGKLDRR
jgi:histidine triad (HIT) family protein